MIDEEIIKEYEAMKEHFGELPNPDQEPRRFAYYVKLWKYYKSKQNENSSDE